MPLLGALLAIVAAGCAPETASAPALMRVDHLVYAGPDLDAAVERVEALLGIRATPGGEHPGEGTRNALIALGPEVYLEILGPDPRQPGGAGPRWFRVDLPDAPRLVAWAAKGRNLEEIAAQAARGGIGLGSVLSGGRRRPDGAVLSWRFTDPHTLISDGLVPFFIDWGRSPHPAATAAPGATLVGLRAEHPEPRSVEGALRRLGVDLPVTRGTAPALIAVIRSPRGLVELR
ncbi:MAG: VOC family protein [Thermoanaerobaculia bacterium]